MYAGQPYLRMYVFLFFLKIYWQAYEDRRALVVVLLNPSSQGQFQANMLRYIVQVSCLHYKLDKLSVNPICKLAFTYSSVHVADTDNINKKKNTKKQHITKIQ